MISATHSLLGLASGMLVGFSLGLVGGGGSILAVPLMVYVVGVPEPHVAIGTSAIAVAANAAINLSNHARGGTVVWSVALMFAAAGILGAGHDGDRRADAEEPRAGWRLRRQNEYVEPARHHRSRPVYRHAVRL